MSAKDCDGQLSGGWSAFYATPHDVAQGAPHLRTYQGRQSEKFFETFKQPYLPPRPAKPIAEPRAPSLDWGIGGTVPCGRQHLQLSDAADFKYSQKRYLVASESVETPHGFHMGRKGHVYDASGADLKHRRSEPHDLENIMQRKARVPEEMRTETRQIHRPAPPGLKGYLGAEYSVGYFTLGRERATEVARPSGSSGKTRKSFAQKRAEEDMAEQVALVVRLANDDADDDEIEPENAPVG